MTVGEWWAFARSEHPPHRYVAAEGFCGLMKEDQAKISARMAEGLKSDDKDTRCVARRIMETVTVAGWGT